MTSALREILASLLLVGGASVVALAALGVARLPDPFSRMHAAAKAGVGGAGLLLLGTGLAFGTASALLTALAAVAFLVLTAPIASHALGRAAYASGAPLGGASEADALSGVLRRGDFDAHHARTALAARPARPRPEEAQGILPEEIPMTTVLNPARPEAAPGLDRRGEPQVAPDATPPPPSPPRILVCLLGGGPAQRAATEVAMDLAAAAGAGVVGVSGAAFEPGGTRHGAAPPPGVASWADRLASRDRARMREAAAEALAEFQLVADANPHVRAAAYHQEAGPGDAARLLADHDLVVVPSGVGPHGPEDRPGREVAAEIARARLGPALRVARRPSAVRRVLLLVGTTPDCAGLADGLLRSGLWPSAQIGVLPVADYRRGVREAAQAQADLLRAHGRRVAVLDPIDLDFEAEAIRPRLATFDAAVLPCLSMRHPGFLASVRNCAWETAADAVPVVLLP